MPIVATHVAALDLLATGSASSSRERPGGGAEAINRVARTDPGILRNRQDLGRHAA